MKLLIADDELYIRQTLESIDWNQYGIELAGVATDGQEAYEMGRRLRPDVFLTDIRMPHMSGLEVMKQLKQETPHLKVILLSGWADFE